ncbi:MAG: molecular chaperone HtpG [Desulfovibrio sp.]|jgi:molecular chaperone HtpG|nr:molecular chaperone HtpG [Desulfovibrio sp.]
MPKAEKRKFRAETQKVLNILTHSLYTNREIFLRELLSNAADALEKLRFMQSKGEEARDPGLPLEIRISMDKITGVLQITDTGIGMSEKELVDNLGTIAKSGSEQFLAEIEGKSASDKSADLEEDQDASADSGDKGQDGSDKAAAAEDVDGQDGQEGRKGGGQIIGHFGIGFYSVFMVADSVEVISVSAKGDGSPYMWTSDGVSGFSVKRLEGEESAPYKRGTVVRAKIKKEAGEFLEKFNLQSVIRNHSNFLPFPIFLEDERINTTSALWREPRVSVSQEQYADFYKYLSSGSKAPLDFIHISVDAPVQFNALVFIPDTEQDYFSVQHDRWGLDLYVRRVLIERANKDLIPDYLAFLKGVVDTEDLPLNISRETLQENLVLRKISQTLLKQVFSHLEKMAASDNGRYEAFWKLHGKYFKFAFNDYMNKDRAAALMRFISSAENGSCISLDSYISRVKPGQKEIWHIFTPSAEAARVNPHLERFRRKGIEVLYLLEPVDEFALEGLGKYKDFTFKSVEQAEAASLDAFPDVEEAAPAPIALDEEEKAASEKLLERMRAILGDKVREIRVSERLAGSPAVLVSPDGLTSSMDKLLRTMQKNDELPQKILEINLEHPILRALARICAKDPESALLTDLTLNLLDNALLFDGIMNAPQLMADRGIKLMDRALSWYTDLSQI